MTEPFRSNNGKNTDWRRRRDQGNNKVEDGHNYTAVRSYRDKDSHYSKRKYENLRTEPDITEREMRQFQHLHTGFTKNDCKISSGDTSRDELVLNYGVQKFVYVDWDNLVWDKGSFASGENSRNCSTKGRVEWKNKHFKEEIEQKSSQTGERKHGTCGKFLDGTLSLIRSLTESKFQVVIVRKSIEEFERDLGLLVQEQFVQVKHGGGGGQVGIDGIDVGGSVCGDTCGSDHGHESTNGTKSSQTRNTACNAKINTTDSETDVGTIQALLEGITCTLESLPTLPPPESACEIFFITGDYDMCKRALHKYQERVKVITVSWYQFLEEFELCSIHALKLEEVEDYLLFSGDGNVGGGIGIGDGVCAGNKSDETSGDAVDSGKGGIHDRKGEEGGDGGKNMPATCLLTDTVSLPKVYHFSGFAGAERLRLHRYFRNWQLAVDPTRYSHGCTIWPAV
eukprot:TRINITY_DN9730_c0_g1_i3.p1 TRINITY_DN9730_c0_g1~~TRINITY_DN9730_c0_g1_i3.p1  ORF type:complete len:453 (+),score=84.65 TRINITY_DN9730_c0_g1_i3:32-1390(+)